MSEDTKNIEQTAAGRSKVPEYLNEVVEIFKKQWSNPVQNNAQLSDFERLNTLGTGAFGRVILVRHTQHQKYYAMKILTKEKDNMYLFIVLEFVGGGEMFTQLQRVGRFSEPQAKLYACEVILAMEYLQALNIVYRDLKPENLLIDPEGHVKMTDFGFAKIIKDRTYTVCGTPEYIAPEIIENKGYAFAADWWSVGILIYEMNAGFAPFRSSSDMNVYEQICKAKFKCPSFFPASLKDLLKHLIQKDLTFRYGNLHGGVNDIKQHKWFSEINWLAVYEKKVAPPFVPKTKDAGDVSNFEKYPAEVLKQADRDKYAKEFADF